MSEQRRPKATRMTICDLCDGEIPEGKPDETGSLTTGYIAHPVTPKTKRAWLAWPPGGRKREGRWNATDLKERRYDFHAECILRLVEANLFTPAPTSPGYTDGGGDRG